MMLVRTTVTLDRDVEALLRKAMRARGEKFKQILNEAIRDGLRAEKSGCTARRFRQRTFRLGPPLGSHQGSTAGGRTWGVWNGCADAAPSVSMKFFERFAGLSFESLTPRLRYPGRNRSRLAQLYQSVVQGWTAAALSAASRRIVSSRESARLGDSCNTTRESRSLKITA
jgi:hypothetical protein